jgi:hypothetical protein
MMDDVIPVSLTNGETDAHNYFIDAEENSLMVTNPNDSGLGSLRDALLNAIAGDTIHFHPVMEGETILINSETLLIDKNITVYSYFDPRTMIESQIQGLFEIAEGITVEFNGVDIKSGLAGNEGAAFYNLGFLILKDVSIYKNTLLAQGEFLIYNAEGSHLSIFGACYFQINN